MRSLTRFVLQIFGAFTLLVGLALTRHEPLPENLWAMQLDKSVRLVLRHPQTGLTHRLSPVGLPFIGYHWSADGEWALLIVGSEDRLYRVHWSGHDFEQLRVVDPVQVLMQMLISRLEVDDTWVFVELNRVRYIPHSNAPPQTLVDNLGYSSTTSGAGRVYQHGDWLYAVGQSDIDLTAVHRLRPDGSNLQLLTTVPGTHPVISSSSDVEWLLLATSENAYQINTRTGETLALIDRPCPAAAAGSGDATQTLRLSRMWLHDDDTITAIAGPQATSFNQHTVPTLVRIEDGQLIPLMDNLPTGTIIQDWNTEWIAGYIASGIEPAIFTVRLDGSDQRIITPGETCLNLYWSADGNWLIFGSVQGKQCLVQRYSPITGEIMPLIAMPLETNLGYTRHPDWLHFSTPDHTNHLLRVDGSQHITFGDGAVFGWAQLPDFTHPYDWSMGVGALALGVSSVWVGWRSWCELARRS